MPRILDSTLSAVARDLKNESFFNSTFPNGAFGSSSLADFQLSKENVPVQRNWLHRGLCVQRKCQ